MGIRHLSEQFPGHAGVEGQNLTLVRPDYRPDPPAAILSDDRERSGDARGGIQPQIEALGLGRRCRAPGPKPLIVRA